MKSILKFSYFQNKFRSYIHTFIGYNAYLQLYIYIQFFHLIDRVLYYSSSQQYSRYDEIIAISSFHSTHDIGLCVLFFVHPSVEFSENRSASGQFRSQAIGSFTLSFLVEKRPKTSCVLQHNLFKEFFFYT